TRKSSVAKDMVAPHRRKHTANSVHHRNFQIFLKPPLMAFVRDSPLSTGVPGSLQFPFRRSMKTTLYLVRHGETDYNRASIMQGRRVDARLNAVGRAQAAALARRFARAPLDAIYTSTLARARETALAVAAVQPEATFVELSDLEEMS